MHHGARADDTVITDGCAFQDDAMRANPHIVTDRHWCRDWPAGLALGQNDLMKISIHDVAVPRNQTAFSDRQALGDIDHRAWADRTKLANAKLGWTLAPADDSDLT